MGATPLRLATAVGMIDGSYRDEVFVCVDNNSTKPFMIKRGTAYFQAVACDGGEMKQEVVDPSTAPGFQTDEGNEPFHAAPAPHWREVPGNALRSREFRRAPHLRKTRVAGRHHNRATKGSIHSPGLYNPFTDRLYPSTLVDYEGDGSGEPCAVARSCSLREAETNAKARKALLDEWKRLREQGTWDETRVRSKR